MEGERGLSSLPGLQERRVLRQPQLQTFSQTLLGGLKLLCDKSIVGFCLPALGVGGIALRGQRDESLRFCLGLRLITEVGHVELAQGNVGGAQLRPEIFSAMKNIFLD